MHKIKGRVLVYETGAPVSNVIVAAFDVDPSTEPNLANLPAMDRLGSAATDAHGEFSIEFTEEEFHDGTDLEGRPDITVAVYPPHVAGADPSEEVEPLYVTPGVRLDAGREEAFVIFLPANLLRERGIPLFAEEVSGEVEDLKESIRQTLENRAKTVSVIREALRPEVEHRITLRRQQLQQATRLLGGTPRPGTIADRFVPAGSDATPTLKAARRAGLERLASFTPRGMRVRLTPEMVEALDLELADDGSLAGPQTISANQFEQFFGPVLAAPVRVLDPLLLCRVRHQVDKETEDSSETDTGTAENEAAAPSLPPGDGTSPTDGTGNLEQTLQATILKQVQDTILGSTLGDQEAIGARRTQLIAEDLDVKLTGGPADGPALHDFHFLQIAWEDVWTAAVDHELAGKMADLYKEIVKVMDWGTTIPDLSEISELEQFLKMLEDALEVASDIGKSPMGESPLPGDGSALPPTTGDADIPIPDLPVDLPDLPVDLPDLPVDLPIFDMWFPPEMQSSVNTWLSRAKRLLIEIQTRLAEPYRFDVFKPCSHNFGIIVTYRQRWQPEAYQVGEMVGTIPLAPGEKRTYTKKRIVKTSRAQKEVEKALSSRRDESTETTRAEAEILRKASYSTNFKMTAEGGFTVGVVNAEGSTEQTTNQTFWSQNKKRDFREAVTKAAQEYRNERTVEVSTEETITDEFVETGEISNPNDELTVTYMFYELQRRFEISERLHRVTPVILVAFEVPAPNKIDEAWLLEHEWILRRVILDDEFLPALDYLTDTFAGDELSVEVHRVHWQTQIRVVKELHEVAALHTRAREEARAALQRALSRVAKTGGGGILDSTFDLVFGDDDADKAASVAAGQQAAQTALEWIEADLEAAGERLTSAINALQEATDAYTAALERRLNRRVAIDQLRLHVKQNILYYMQAIWLHEPSDQRYLRVYDKEIEWPEIKEAKYYLTPVNEHSPVPDEFSFPNQPKVKWVEARKPPAILDKTRKLHEVADVDNLLGFKGNYAIFPLKEGNALTDYMMQSFLDSYFGVFDPDPFGEIPPPSEALEIARCAWQDASDEEKQRITEWLVGVLNNQRRISEIIVVPTNHLYIEALPGSHPLLEDFKLRHRMIDVQKVRAEVMQERLEALRYAARIAGGELGDPDVQTQIIAPDSAGVNVTAPSSSSGPNP